MLNRCFGVLCAILIFLPSMSQAAPYIDHGHFYTIEFPTGWSIQDQNLPTNEWVTAQSLAENAKDTYLESIQIILSLKESSITVDEYLPKFIQFMKEKYQGASIQEIISTKIDGHEAKQILFTAIGPSKEGEQILLKAQHYILVHNKHLMIILCVSSEKDFEKWSPVFKNTITSLKFFE